MGTLFDRTAARLSLVFAPLLLVPSAAFAASSGFFGPLIPQTGACLCPGSNGAMDYGCVLVVVQNGIDLAVSLAILYLILMIALTGLRFITGGANPGARSKAKNQFLNIVLGIALVLCSWLIVDFVMKVLYNPDAGFGPWNSILAGSGSDWCIQQNMNSSILSNITLPPSTSGTGVGSGGGSCVVHDTGACAQSNFSNFGSAAPQASEICSAESGNGTLLEGDKISGTKDAGKPVSIGLFQINLTQHDVAGLPCHTAFDSTFTGSHKNVTITNPGLYQQCVAAAKVPSNNAAVAYSIYSKDHNSWREWSTHTKCGLALAAFGPLAYAGCSAME